MRTRRQLVRTCVLVCLALPLGGAVGGEPLRLTTDGKSKADPVFVKNGAEVVYTVYETPTQTSLMRVRVADGTTERLHPQATTSEFEAAFTPDGSAYAFVQSRGNLNLKLVIRDVSANKEAGFDPGSGFASLRRPTFAPDGGRVAFSVPAPSGQTIASVDRTGKDFKTLAGGGMNNWPAYSPDGKSIAFASSRGGDYDLYTMRADGTDIRRLLKRPGMDARPAWSPDGKRVAFTAACDGNYEIMVVNADGTGLTPAVAHPDRDDYPVWHPDGKTIVFVGERAGKSDLYMIQAP